MKRSLLTRIQHLLRFLFFSLKVQCQNCLPPTLCTVWLCYLFEIQFSSFVSFGVLEFIILLLKSLWNINMVPSVRTFSLENIILDLTPNQFFILKLILIKQSSNKGISNYLLLLYLKKVFLFFLLKLIFQFQNPGHILNWWQIIQRKQYHPKEKTRKMADVMIE